MASGKKKLLVLTSTYPRRPGDSEPAFVHELNCRLAANYEITVIAPHCRGAQLYEVMDGVRVCRYRYLPEAWASLAYAGGIPAKLKRNPLYLLQVPFFLAGQFLAAWRETQFQGADLIHAHWILPQGLIGALLVRLLRQPAALVCTAHGTDLYAFDFQPFRLLKRWILRNADAVTVVSRAMIDAAVKLGARAELIHVAPMGVDVVSKFVPPLDETRRADRILFVGRLTEQKGVHCLIKAFHSVIGTCPGACLVIVGDGPQRGALEGVARDLGISDSVQFRGALAHAELPVEYQRAAVTVFPSTGTEGMGLVVIEAQACACPVVASDLPGVHDTIIDGDTGLLFKPDDAAALQSAILRILEDRDLAGRLGRNGRNAACRHFGWDRIAERYAAILLGARREFGTGSP